MSRIDFTVQLYENDEHPWVPTESEMAYREAADRMELALMDYLQPDCTWSLDEAINQIGPLFNGSTGLLLSDLPYKIPYDHPSHQKLAEFVAAYCKSGEWLFWSRCATSEKAFDMFWDKLGIILRHEAMLDPEDFIDDSLSPMIYANMRAFLAELAWPDEPFCFSWARIALDEAFEDGRSNGVVEVLDAKVIGAAQYIIRQAPIIFSESFKIEPPEPEQAKSRTPFAMLKRLFLRVTRRTTKCSEPLRDFTQTRWQSWKSGFRTVAASDKYGQRCREIAERAADLMVLQEKINDESSGS